MGSKTEGSVTLPSQRFYPHGFDGELTIAGTDDSKLHLRIEALGVDHAQRRLDVNEAHVSDDL